MSKRFITALLEFEPSALDSLLDYISKREAACSQSLMSDEGPALYRAQGAFRELQEIRTMARNAISEAQHSRINEQVVH